VPVRVVCVCVCVVEVVREARGVVALLGVVVLVWPGTLVAGGAVPVGSVVVAGVGVVGIVGGGTTAAGGSVSTTAVGVVPTGTPSSPVSRKNANASSAPASRTIAPIATVGSCQFGVGASRVRAGAPHSRHQSWSGPTVAEQRGQRSDPGGGS
jgi:hypothetical protein